MDKLSIEISHTFRYQFLKVNLAFNFTKSVCLESEPIHVNK